MSQLRFPTREVRIGDLRIGGTNPVLVQSMTIADTMDTEAVCAEIRQLVEAGCPLVRVTAPSKREAENLRAIRERLKADGIRVPMVADIHFTPNAALIAADIVEKVRINPGNYADRKRFQVFDISDADYARELERIRDKFLPLVERLKTNGAALRIGTNHGSLSDRIMNRFGDTPEGMVESALEFVRICREANYHDIVLSMKSSIPSVMIAAYRLLVQRMIAEDMDYPIHIGVTEAGDGLEGRVKSAVGIGSLLAGGIGDTIRVSLTEDAHHELGAAANILAAVEAECAGPSIESASLPPAWNRLSTDTSHARREVRAVSVGDVGIGTEGPVRVAAEVELVVRSGDTPRARFADDAETRRTLRRAGADAGTEVLVVRPRPVDGTLAGSIATIARDLAGPAFDAAGRFGRPPVPLLLDWTDVSPFPGAVAALAGIVAGHVVPAGIGPDVWTALDTHRAVAVVGVTDARDVKAIADRPRSVPTIVTVRGGSRWVDRLRSVVASAGDVPVWLHLPRHGATAAIVGGAALNEGIGDLVSTGDHSGLEATPWPPGGVSWSDDAVDGAYRLLQACRVRHTRAEFIACPSCGRTQFDLQSTTARIRARTAHLKGVKIAIMGCIVNGPGEMADADFGYVGSGVKKVDLYVGKTRVEKNIPEDDAEDRLVALLVEHDAWIDPEAAAEASDVAT